MKFTFSSPSPERSDRCGKVAHITVEAGNEEEAREKAMLERWGPPRGIFSTLKRWNGYGLILEERVRLNTPE